MAGLEDLITFMAIDQAKQKAIADADPYAAPAGIADSLAQTVLGSGNQFKTRDKMIAGAVLGMLGGGLTGASEDYTARAQGAYRDVISDSILGRQVERPSVLSSGLFRSAKDQSNLFKLSNQLQSAQLERDLQKQIALEEVKSGINTKAKVVEEVIKNPRQADRILGAYSNLFGTRKTAPTTAEVPSVNLSGIDSDESGLGLALGGASQAPAVAADTVAKPNLDPAMQKALGILGDSFQIPESIEDKQSRIAQRFMDEGATPGAAWESAAKQIEADRLALKGTATKSVAVRDAANKALQLADTAEAGLIGAGETGGLLNMPRNVASLAYSFISPEEEGQRASTRILDSVSPEIVQSLRSPGAVSDFETKMMIGAGPSSSNTPAANRAIIDKMRGVGKINLEYADFLDWYRDKVGTMTGAEKVWSAYKAENPLIVKDETGTPMFSQSRRSIFDWLNDAQPVSPEAVAKAQSEAQVATQPAQRAATPQTDSALNKIGQIASELTSDFTTDGIAKTPEAFGAMVNPETYKQAFKDPVTSLETVGRGGAMMAGAATGGTLGAAVGGPLAPLTALLGAGLGAGAGYLGFNSAEEAASELAGVGTEKTVIPTYEEVREATRIAGQGAGTGAVVKGAQLGGRAIKGAVKTADNLAGETVGAAKSELVGIKPKDLRASVKNGSAKYFDEAGNEVAVKDIKNAATYESKVEQAVNTIDKDGFFAKAKNDPKAMRVEFDKSTKTAAQEISDLHNTADATLKQIHSQLSPVQQKQFPLSRDPKTGKGGFLPNKSDFQPVFDRINEISKTDPQIAKSLIGRANEVIDKWNKSSRSYNALQDRKSLFGAAAKWGKGSTATTDAWNLVKQDFNRVFADAQMKAFDYAMKSADPSKVGALAEANSKFAAYKTLEPIMKSKAASGKPSVKFGLFGSRIPESVFRRSPATALKGAEAVQRGTGMLSNAAQGVGNAVNRASQYAPNPAAIPGTLSGTDEITAAYEQLKSGRPAPVAAPTATPVQQEQVSMAIDPVVAEFEGGQQLKAYPPPLKGSGVTVGTGIDLGGRSVKELENLGLSEGLVKKLTPYVGKKDEAAASALKAKPLTLKQEEADELDRVVSGAIGAEVNAKYRAATGGDIATLPQEAQTVIASLAHNFGAGFDKKLPSLWKDIVAGDWAALQDKLINTKWKQPELLARRKQEAALLNPLIEVA